MNVLWRHYRTVAAGAPGGVAPVAKGYFKLAFFLYDALSKIPGLRVHDWPVESHPKMVFHLCPPHLFQPLPGKVNVLASMWEGDALPAAVVAQLRRADWCVVPSRYCQRVWRAHGVEAAYMPLGVADAYVTADPSRSIVATAEKRRLRFLFVGSKLKRKGWEFLAPAWEMAFGQSAPHELYVKTIRPEHEKTDRPLVSEFTQGAARFVVDERDLDEAQMFELYRSADAFLFPSYGEGFGLPALEAMAAGCLVVAPEITGLAEFVNRYTALPIPLSEPMRADYGGVYLARFPTVDGLAACLRRADRDWGLPSLETIRRTGANYAKRFSWQTSAVRLVAILQAIAERKGLPPEPAERKEAELVH